MATYYHVARSWLQTRLTPTIAATNRTIAVWLTRSVGTMTCAYLFALLAILGFPGFGASMQAYVQWTSQTFIQLTMLSILAVGQQVQGEQSTGHHRQQMAAHDAHAARADAHEQRLAALEERLAGKRLVSKASGKKVAS